MEPYSLYLLAPYAVPLEGTLGRAYPEADDAMRNPFQRDRDRIIHSQAFRRLQGKTQVFVAGEGDHFRTRLTHTMEVAQIARDIARYLRLNEDLAEAIALAHDLGHPPFGHTGEAAVDAWMHAHGSRFEHNEQSLRIVTVLEEHATSIPGLNLSKEILEGMQKHATNLPRGHSLEAQVVNLADEIAYVAHDFEDGLRAGMFTEADARDVTLAEEARSLTTERGTPVSGTLIALLVRDLCATTLEKLAERNIATLEDIYAIPETLTAFSHKRREELNILRTFLWEKLYLHPRVRIPSDAGAEIVMRLLHALLEHPTEKVLTLQKRTGSSLPEAVKDYVAGMTDAFAQSAVISGQ